jgi:hypothetical protein
MRLGGGAALDHERSSPRAPASADHERLGAASVAPRSSCSGTSTAAARGSPRRLQFGGGFRAQLREADELVDPF